MTIGLSACRAIVFVAAATSGIHATADTSGFPLSWHIGAPALSTTNLSLNGGTLFEATFDARSLEGDLVARSIDRYGYISPDEFYPLDPGVAGYVAAMAGELKIFNGIWRAAIRVTAQSRRDGANDDNRVIFTSTEDAPGVLRGRRFQWDNSAGDGLSAAMKSEINSGTPATAERDRVVDWTRGHGTNEGEEASDLRQRRFVLGSLMYGGPLYVGPPNGFTSDPGYAHFRSANRNRAPLVFAGGTDGMLHAFNAGDGGELFAYIPGAVLGELKQRALPNYTDTPLVAGPLASGDAFGGFARCTGSPCWRSILVGGLGPGGRSVFALDITDPQSDIGETDRESNAARSIFLWEFRHEHLGLSSSRPLITKLGDGTWIVVFGNGSGTGVSALFVVDAAGGELLYEIRTPSAGNTNGLSPPAAWDADHDGDVDVVYAGDHEGNLWKFDFSEASGDPDDGRDPSIALSGNSLFKITGAGTRPTLPVSTPTLVSPGGNGELMVFFGSNGTQATGGSVYGIRDENRSWGTDPPLTVRTISGSATPYTYRLIIAGTTPDDPAGWKLQLPPGERSVQGLTLSNRRIEFISSAAKSPGRTDNWFTGVDFLTGAAPASPFLDLDSSGAADQQDIFTDTNDDGEFTTDDDFTPVGMFVGTGTVSAQATAVTSGGMGAMFVSRAPSPDAPARPGGPGVPGGRFDQDNFDWSPAQFNECNRQAPDGQDKPCGAPMSCWGGAGSTSVCHTDGYDDVWDIDGVNMLFAGGSIASPPDMESATGILSGRHRALHQAMRLEQAGVTGSGLREYTASVNDEIRLWIRNPNSVDTRTQVDLRIAAGLHPAGSEPAAPPTLYFNCDRDSDGFGDSRMVVDAPGFNLLPASARTCVIEDITELRVRHHDINALRATLPECVASHHNSVPPQSLGPTTVPHPNTGYRNGAFTVQAIATGRRRTLTAGRLMAPSSVDSGIVIWENVNFENFGESCAAFNEALRTEKEPSGNTTDDPSDSGGDNAQGSDPAVVDGAGGSTLAIDVDVARSAPPDGRVSWREVLD